MLRMAGRFCSSGCVTSAAQGERTAQTTLQDQFADRLIILNAHLASVMCTLPCSCPLRTGTAGKTAAHTHTSRHSHTLIHCLFHTHTHTHMVSWILKVWLLDSLTIHWKPCWSLMRGFVQLYLNHMITTQKMIFISVNSLLLFLNKEVRREQSTGTCEWKWRIKRLLFPIVSVFTFIQTEPLPPLCTKHQCLPHVADTTLLHRCDTTLLHLCFKPK